MCVDAPAYSARLRPSKSIVVRQIECELILVPLTAGIGDLDDELYAFNETGAAIWRKFDELHSLEEIALELASEFDAPLERIRDDVVCLARELLARGILVKS